MEGGIPIISTKILTPRRRDDILLRQRLLDLLFELMDMRLVIVASPAGYGKTSLMVDFVNENKIPTCWLSLDTFDQDVQRFAVHLVAAVKSRFPNFGRTSMAAVQNLDLEQTNVDSLASLIANDIYENVKEHFAIILDDYHLIEENRTVTALINQLIQRVDENCHFIIASRTLLNLPDMTLLVARSMVGGLSYEELAFQPEEIQDLWLKNFHLSMSANEAAELASETEGWITGLLLSRQVQAGKMPERMRGAKVAGVGLYEYLVEQVLERQPLQVQQFLLRTSLLEEFDADLCREVLGAALGEEQNWEELVGAVLRANLFIQPIGDEHIYLRYHHLFCDFLQSRMQRLHPNETSCIHISLAETWARRGHWERSYRVFKRVNRSEEIARLIERAGPDLIARGRVTILSEWLDDLPEGYFQRPTLESLRGAVYVVRGRTDDGLALLEHAIQAFEEAGDRDNLALTLNRRATAHKLLGRYHRSIDDLNRVLEITKDLPEGKLVRADAMAGLGSAYYHEGNLVSARKWMASANQAFEQLNDGESVAKTSMQIGVVTRALGLYNESENAYTKALEYYRSSGNLIWQANVLNNLGVLQHLRGNYESAASSFEKAILYASIGGYARLEAYALTSIGDLYRDLNATDEAQEAYHQARPIALRVNDRFLIFYLDLVEASLSRILGHLKHAERLVDVAWQAANKSRSEFQMNLCSLERACIAIQERNFLKAIPELEGSLAYFEKEGHRAESLQAHFYLAAARRALADRQAAVAHMEQVFSASVSDAAKNCVAVTGRYLRFDLESMCIDPEFERPATSILRLVDQFERQIPALRRLLRRQSQTIPLGPPKLAIHTLGRVQVKVNDHVVTNAEWVTMSARDLFLLIAAQPDGISKAEVGNILWPDSSPAELRMRFKNTIYRLRRAVGKEAILFDEDIYRFNHDLDYEEDSESFRREIELAEKAPDPERKAYHYKAAYRLYGGSFLPDLDEDWVYLIREQLQRQYIDMLLKLTYIELDRHQYDEALHYVAVLLKEDHCLEEAHRLGMLVHAATGNRAGIMRQYEECSQALLKEYKTMPSVQTQQLYHTLMH